MEPMNPEYSLKNIPTPPIDSYLRNLMWKIELFIIRLRWKVFFFENPDAKSKQKETYGFNSELCPPKSAALKAFEDSLYQLAQDLEFREYKSTLQSKLKADLRKIRRSGKVIAFADKSSNMYMLNPQKYSQLLQENTTQKYKKTDYNTILDINKKTSKLAKKLEIDDRMECYAQTESYVTVKDHKENFPNVIKCRLINPAKSEIGIVSKKILQQTNATIRQTLGVQQWRNTSAVIDWFQGLRKSKTSKFMLFDIEEFYPSISEALLIRTIEFAKQHSNITHKDIEIIMDARNSLLFKQTEPWIKKTGTFDVTMGSYDGAEICELVGLHLLDRLSKLLDKNSVGLYRDDGLAHLENLSPQQTENLKKKMFNLFKVEGLRITIETNLRKVNFLDTTLCLDSKTYSPYRKPNSNPLYIHTQSNHPLATIKQLPHNINDRLCSLSSSEAQFNAHKETYKNALSKAGHHTELKYKAPQNKDKTKRKRKRQIIWFNPPMNRALKTNVGKKFLQLIDLHFPKHNHLSKILNRKSIKISYSCTSNMKNLIKLHNQRILNPEKTMKPCNCRGECPLNKNCQAEAIVYKAIVKTNEKEMIYYGSAETPFKKRFANHKNSFKDPRKRNVTELAKYIWKLKDENTKFDIYWSTAARSNPYRAGSRKCNLCLAEKTIILREKSPNLLNTRDELISGCRHRAKFKMKNL